MLWRDPYHRSIRCPGERTDRNSLRQPPLFRDVAHWRVSQSGLPVSSSFLVKPPRRMPDARLSRRFATSSILLVEIATVSATLSVVCTTTCVSISMLRAIEQDRDRRLRAVQAKTAIAELAESVLRRISRVIGGGTFSRSSPFGYWYEDVRALGFLRPPLGLTYDQLFEWDASSCVDHQP
jgi:hypothetical protein